MRKPRGMTLIEIGIAMAIAGILLAISVPAISNVTRAALRQKSGQLAGAMRSLYGTTALAGKSCRLVFDLDAGTYGSECAQGAARLDREGEKSRNGERESTREEELLAQVKGSSDALSTEEAARLELLRKSAFAPSTDVPPTELGSSVKLARIWVSHQPEPYTKGKAYLYFWPGGQTESASVRLEQGDDAITLVVSPLTGRVQVVSGDAKAAGER